MAALKCPYCWALANFTQQGAWQTVSTGTTHAGTYAAWTCDACGGAIVGERNSMGAPIDPLPKTVANPTFPDVDEPVAQDANEAHRCFSVGAWRATAAMTRRAIQTAAYSLEAPEKKLLDQIDWLADNSHIPTQMKDVAHQIRLGGNAGAHPDHDGIHDVGEAEAQALLEFLDDFLKYVFQIPANLKRLQSSQAP